MQLLGRMVPSPIFACCTGPMTAWIAMRALRWRVATFVQQPKMAAPLLWRRLSVFLFRRGNPHFEKTKQITYPGNLVAFSRLGRLLFLNDFVDGGAGADFIVGPVGPAAGRKIAGINAWNSAFAHD